MNNNYFRTFIGYVSILTLILATSEDLSDKKTGQSFKNNELSSHVEATGIEPV